MVINGRLEVLGALGRGSHALVLLVADRVRGGERLAAKVLEPGRDSDLLRWEFAQLTALRHPNLAMAHALETVTTVEGEGDLALEPGALILTQDFAEGRPADLVADELEAGAREAFAVAVAGALARALGHLHERGILHRDVKPANVIVGDRPEDARLVDLALSGPARLDGMVSGSLAFMAPEAMAGSPEPRSDLFSLGATLYRLLTGRLPFGPAEDLPGTIRAILDGAAPDLLSRCPDLAPGLAALVTSLLAPEAARRPASAELVHLELGRLFGPEAVGLDGGALGVVDGAAPPRRLPAPDGGPVIGRERELLRLYDLVATCLDPAGPGAQVLALSGAAGVGKSALVRALGQRLQLRAAAEGRPTPAVVAGDLASVSRALLAQAGHRAPPCPRLAAWLGEAPAVGSSPQRAALFDELAAVALAAAAARPTLLHLDATGGVSTEPMARDDLAFDLAVYLHGLGGLGSVGREIRPALAVILETRSEGCEGLPEALSRVEVPPLEDAAVEAFVADRLGGASPARLVRAARLACRGRPALLEAFLARVVAQGGPDALDDEALEALDLGPEGEEALDAALSALAEGPREALVGLAFLGVPATPAELAELLGLATAETTARLGELWREGLVLVDDGVLFAPRPADRTALAERVPASRRPRLHYLAADILGQRALVEEGDDEEAEASRRAQLKDAAAPSGRGGVGGERGGEASGRSRRVAWAGSAGSTAGDLGWDRTGPEWSRSAAEAAALLARAGRRGPAVTAARARHAVGAGLGAEAGELSLAAGQALAASGDAGGAVLHLEAATTLGRPEVAAAAEALLRRVLLAAGRYDEAARRLRKAVRRREPGARVELGRALRLAGDLEGAKREAELAARSRAGGAAGRALLARLALDSGDARGALNAAGDPPSAATLGQGADDLEESVGLACLALGEEPRAAAHFAACLELRRAAGEPAAVARAENLLGMVAHHRGEWPVAAAHYATAVALAAGAGHLHAEATYSVNLASCRLETGDLGGALGPLRRAVSALAGLGREGELAGALFNFGTLLAALGDLEGAARVRDRAAAAASRAGARHVEAYCALLEGDLLTRRGRPGQAVEAYGRAAGAFEALRAPRELLLARLHRVEARAAAGDRDGAALELAEVRSGPGREPSPDLGVRLALAGARLALAGRGEPAAALFELESARTLAEGRGQRELLWRIDLLAASLAARQGDGASARERLGRARRGAEATAASVPPLHRPGLESDPDREALRRLESELRGGTMPGREAHSVEDPSVLRRLLAINKRLNSELRLGRLLDEIIDTVVELTEAERGFLLLKEKDGSLVPRSARNIDRTSLRGADLALSRSIAERVVASGSPLVTVDAQADGRFGATASVHALRLRSILAVPLRVRGEVVGAVYVDDRLRPGAFGDDALPLVQHVADQAAIAVETARLLTENRRRQREVEGLAQKLQKEVDRQRVELEELRRELDGKRAELETKYSYDKILSRSAAMASVFRVLDRVTDSEVPVVIEGESGTGKELVARAIHFNGPRRGRPFVTENCGAIPETLLESALFGHVRGAFTGADRTRPGLFEVASGGTLLLDEVSEMSPAMQAKLLRVLQEGELRPVGGDRTVRVDVRVIASANRDLGELVRSGRFREDLYYRLNVITVRLPPLRERPEDISLLVEHFLEKHGGRVRAVDRAALRRLTTHGWPGNVRQLENEVMRAAVLADDVIHEEHLSPELREPGSGSGGRPPDDLDLRARVDELERTLIGKALVRFRGNQSKAAEALGVSRFGLQKKMKRLGIDPRGGWADR